MALARRSSSELFKVPGSVLEGDKHFYGRSIGYDGSCGKV